LAWVPQRQVHVLFVAWKSEYFAKGGWTPLQRCQVVSEKFHKFNESGLLNYLTTGTVKGYPVICVAKNFGETCNGNNLLFTLKDDANPEVVLRQLMNIAEGKSSEPTYQSSGPRTYLNVKNYLNNAPVVNVKK
ncbi:MAG: COP23 domain-containing protein, partial [Sphaerospermopsis kisseleviana]